MDDFKIYGNPASDLENLKKAFKCLDKLGIIHSVKK